MCISGVSAKVGNFVQWAGVASVSARSPLQELVGGPDMVTKGFLGMY